MPLGLYHCYRHWTWSDAYEVAPVHDQLVEFEASSLMPGSSTFEELLCAHGAVCYAPAAGWDERLSSHSIASRVGSLFRGKISWPVDGLLPIQNCFLAS